MTADLITTSEAAIMLGWSYDHTRKRLRQQKPAKVIGKNRLWSADQIEALK